jgi:hypothetical protein
MPQESTEYREMDPGKYAVAGAAAGIPVAGALAAGDVYNKFFGSPQAPASAPKVRAPVPASTMIPIPKNLPTTEFPSPELMIKPKDYVNPYGYGEPAVNSVNINQDISDVHSGSRNMGTMGKNNPAPKIEGFERIGNNRIWTPEGANVQPTAQELFAARQAELNDARQKAMDKIQRANLSEAAKQEARRAYLAQEGSRRALTESTQIPASTKSPSAIERFGKVLTPGGMGGKILNKIIPVGALAGAAAEYADASNRYHHGDIPGAFISGLGALGSAASVIPTPMTRGIGTALSLGAPALNYGIDKLRGAPVKKAEGRSTNDDAKNFQLSTGSIEDLLAGNTDFSHFLSQAKHDLTHFPKMDKNKVDEFATDMAMNFGPMGVGSIADAGAKKLGKILSSSGDVVKPTVRNPERAEFPDIYRDPRIIVNESAKRVPEESPLLKQLFGVNRQDLDDMTRAMGPNLSADYYKAKTPPKYIDRLTVPKNTQRVQDVLGEAQADPRFTGSYGWYQSDPLKQRFIELNPNGAYDFDRFTQLGSGLSPSTAVPQEIKRSSVAYMMDKNGRLPDFLDPTNMPPGYGHAYHTSAHNSAVQNMIDRGDFRPLKLQDAPKTRVYYGSRSGENLDVPTADAHFVRGIGLADLRPTSFAKKPSYGKSINATELDPVSNWFGSKVSAPMDMRSSPAQALQWNAMGTSTGVDTELGVPFLELLSRRIGDVAKKEGIHPTKVRDDFIQGKRHLKEGGLAQVKKFDKGGQTDAQKFRLSTGSIEDLLGGYITPSQFPAAAKHDLTHFPKVDKKSVNNMAKEMAMNYGPMSLGHLAPGLMGTIKNVGGNWIPVSQVALEDQLRMLSRTRLPGVTMPQYTDTNKAVNNWASTTGRKYLLNRLGSSQDEIKNLYDQGIMHMSPTELAARSEDFYSGSIDDIEALNRKRARAGITENNSAKTELGQTWENTSDAAIQPIQAKHYQWDSMKSPDWVHKLDPESLMYRQANQVINLPKAAGIDKLTSALENDIAAGKLRPEQLNKVSIEDAVRRAHQQRLEGEAATESAAQAIPKVREYPEGYSWHDLTHEDPKMLDAILKKEGEIMQNCIGGYCDDVMEGGTKLYSLRDAKGEPHVNVEVRPSEKGPIMRQVMGKQNEKPSDDYMPFAKDFAVNPVGGTPYSSIWSADELGLIDANKLRTHGLAGNSMSPYYDALDRIFPSERGVLSGPLGVRIPATQMLKMTTQDLPGTYLTPDQILSHLATQEPRPMEQSFSKYYENLGLPYRAGGGLIENTGPASWGAGIDPEKAKANLNAPVSDAKWNNKQQLVTPSGRIISEAPSAADAALLINQFMPVTGDIQSGVMAANDLANKQYGSAALNALGVLPFIPSLGGIIKNEPKIYENANATLAKLNLTDADVAAWREANKFGRKQVQHPMVKQAANDLLDGKITSDQYRDIALEHLPIKPLESVPEMPTHHEIASSLDRSQLDKGIVGLNNNIKNGTRVASRLDIPSYDAFDKWIVSLHEGTTNGGPAIGYGQTALLKGSPDNLIEFKSSPKGAANIASGRTSKGTIARIHGNWENHDPEALREYAHQLLNHPDWVQVGMNPYRHSYFYDKADMMPLTHAEEVIQIGPLVLARKPVKTTPNDPRFRINPKDPKSQTFKKGGPITPSQMRQELLAVTGTNPALRR